MDDFEVRKFALQMAISPVLADPEPLSVAFTSIVEAAITFEKYLKTGENTVEEEPFPINDPMELVKE